MARSGSSAVERLGVLGSAFNPPHFGHLALAQEAVWACGLDRVLFVPTGVAPHKEIESDPGPEVRVAMVQQAVCDEPRFEASAIEVEREGVSYTYLSLEEISATEADCELYLLLGADAALGLPGWKRTDRIADLARLAVARRDGIDRDRLRAALVENRLWERSTFIDMPSFGVSSSLVRSRCAARMPLRYFVPDAVAEMIYERSLYREGGD